MDTNNAASGIAANGNLRIVVRGLSYVYPNSTDPALSDIDLVVHSGEYLAVLGANGSGKSTFLKCLNGLCPPPAGCVRVYGGDGIPLDPSDSGSLRRIRTVLGTVLQNPDDQIVGTVVEEDCVFGPENLGLSQGEVSRRVADALSATGLSDLRTRPPQFLSGGERQRLALAGILALEPRILALDEATAMIDPAGRAAILDILDGLSSGGHTILTVTHSLEEAGRARRCVALNRGRMVFDGAPTELFDHPDLEAWGFRLPDSLRAIRHFSRRFAGFSVSKTDPAAVAAALAPFLRESGEKAKGRDLGNWKAGASVDRDPDAAAPHEERPVVRCIGMGHRYLRGTEYSTGGIEGIGLVLERGQSVALIGATGSGKTTLLKHLNAILLPTEGIVRVFGKDTLDPAVDLRALRFTSVLGVQNPESALFELFVADDVAYGPKNAGLKGAELQERVRRAVDAVGLPFDQFGHRYVRSLSGGEKRRVALAGVLALEGELVILDEPTAALDGQGRDRILALVKALTASGTTVVATTHSMEEAVHFDHVAVMEKGQLIDFGPPREVFGRSALCGGVSPGDRASGGEILPWATAVHRELSLLGVFDARQECSVPPIIPLTAEELTAAVGPSGTPPPEPYSVLAVPSRQAAASPLPRMSPHGIIRRGRTRRRKGTGIEFFRNVTLGQFLDRPSPLRSMGAGTKLSVAAVAGIVAVAAPHPAVSPLLLASTLLVGTFFGRVGPKHLLRGLLPAAPYLVFMAALQFLFSWPGDAGPAFFIVGPISATVHEASRAFLLVFRLAALMAILSLFSAVTPPSEAIRAAAQGLAPLSRLGLPVRELSLIIGIALRFVPVLAEEAERIAVAQLSRGGAYGGKGRLRAAAAMIVPLFLRALERSESLAAAMELRLFDTSKQPS